MEDYIDCDGAKLWTYSEGEGSPILFMSGGPGFADYMEGISQLIDGNYLKVRFDPRGCGKSDDIGPIDVETSIQDIERIRKAKNLEDVILIGHSAGANMLLAYSLQYPMYCKGLIYLTGVGFQNDKGWKEELSRNLETFDDPIPDYDLNMEVNVAINESWVEYLKTPKLFRQLADHDLPVYFIQSENDARPNWTAEQLSELLPNSVYIELKNASHFPWIDNENAFKEILMKALHFVVGE